MSGPRRNDLHARLADKGARLREVRKELLRQQPGSTQRWFQGPDGCDLFLWSDDAHGLVQLQLTFERRVVEWSVAAGLRTGRLASFNPLTPDDDRGRLVFDAAIDAETMELARSLLADANVDAITLAIVQTRLGLRERKQR